MERLKRAAVICELVRKLRSAGSWCGETHIQKAIYLLQDLMQVPTAFPFVLYKHGPFSFELSDELTALRGDELLTLEPQSPPYGPRYERTHLCRTLQSRFPKTLRKYEPSLRSVADVIGARTVGQLERLATALYVTTRQSPFHDGSVQARADYLHRLKPHVSVPAAGEAIKEIDTLMSETALCAD